MKKFILEIFCILTLILMDGCKPSSKNTGSQYFKTHFQNESQFIIENIVSDLAEQIFYEKNHKLPDAKYFFVSVTEKPNSQLATPGYEVRIDLGRRQSVTTELDVNAPIWSPEVYAGVTSALAEKMGVETGGSDISEDTDLLEKLLDGTAATIEEQNQNLSGALENDFDNPVLHEEAAVLLCAFALREHSGDFLEIRSPLCRITAHLAMARFFNKNSLGVNGQMAEIMALTLMNNESDAIEKLNAFKANNVVLTRWVRALEAINTADYRPLDDLNGLSRIEIIAWFEALDKSANTDIAWGKLSDVQKKVPDFVRIANEGDYSVGVGHELLALSIPLEFKELAAIYQMVRQKKLSKEELTSALNQMPDQCFSISSDQKIDVHVIGWGLWAGFFQRQLCHAIQHNFDFLQKKWGVSDEAKKFSDKSDALLSGLRLYPFVKRFDCIDVPTYHQAVDEGFKVTIITPQLVPAECWNYLCYRFNQNEWYKPNPNPHVNEWHNHNPPPGTAYNPFPRLDHPSLINHPDAVERLHKIAPYDRNIAWYIWKTKYKTTPTYSQAMTLFQPMLDYDCYAMERVADTVQSEPDRYEQLLSKAAKLNPSDYFKLGDFFEKKDADKAARYIEEGNLLDPDSVRASYYARWLVNYYLKKGQIEAARHEADFAGEVYSFVGLQAKAGFLEATTNYEGAFQWYSNIEERYDDSGPLIAFCLRYKAKTRDVRYDGEVQKRMNKLFPKGIEKVSLADFQSPPTDGTVINGENDLIRSAGLHKGDIIVAVYGIRIHNFVQYNYGRENISNREMDLIVWQNDHYSEIKTSPPDHRFGVDFGDYPPK